MARSTFVADYTKPAKRTAARLPEPHPCAADFCGQEGCFGLGPPIQPQAWYCPAHLPEDLLVEGGGEEMIRSREALLAALGRGETVAQLTDSAGEPHWAITATGEAVHGMALRAAMRRDELDTVSRDLFGEPMQYGARP